MKPSLLQELKQIDERRPSFPGEHPLVLGAGVALLLNAPRRASWLGRALTFAAGLALVYRGASGRDGPLARLRQP
jgi:hypothetical protein